MEKETPWRTRGMLGRYLRGERERIREPELVGEERGDHERGGGRKGAWRRG
jgi:hypothetical protein